MRCVPVITFIATVTFSPTASALAEDVFVRAAQAGRGFTRSLGAACFVVTPAHVVGDSLVADIVGPGGARGKAESYGTWGDDLAILRLSGSDSFDSFCRSPLQVSRRDARELLDGASDSPTLRQRNEFGALRSSSIEVVSDDYQRYLRIRVAGGDPITRTMSGSIVYVKDEPLGMLMEVNPATGEGLVHRQNYVEDGVRAFFSYDPLPPDVAPIDRGAVPLDATGREVLVATQLVLDLLDHRRDRQVYDRHTTEALRRRLSYDVFAATIAKAYAPIAGTVTRRLVQYVPPGSGASVGLTWMVVLDSQADKLRFQETLVFEHIDGSWLLASISVTERW